MAEEFSQKARQMARLQVELVAHIARRCGEQGVDGDEMISLCCGVTAELAALQTPLDMDIDHAGTELAGRLARAWAFIAPPTIAYGREHEADKQPTVAEVGHG